MNAGGKQQRSWIEPPHFYWSMFMFRKRRTTNGKQASEAGGYYHKVAAIIQRNKKATLNSKLLEARISDGCSIKQPIIAVIAAGCRMQK